MESMFMSEPCAEFGFSQIVGLIITQTALQVASILTKNMPNSGLRNGRIDAPQIAPRVSATHCCIRGFEHLRTDQRVPVKTENIKVKDIRKKSNSIFSNNDFWFVGPSDRFSLE